MINIVRFYELSRNFVIFTRGPGSRLMARVDSEGEKYLEKAIRLDKYLADMGKGTRTELKEMIRKGRITVNGEIVKKPETKIRKGTDEIRLDNAPVEYVELEYYLLNKPQGVISATEDKYRKTVIDLINEKQRRDLFPVGRLDIDTEGLLLITNDGVLAHRLLAPGHHVDKVYEARCAGLVPDEAVQKFHEGMKLSDGLSCMPAELEILKRIPKTTEETEDESFIRLTLHEGKFHQVKRMMEEVGCPVLHLKRLSMGPLKLDDTLKTGEYRKLTDKERELLERL